jgi:mono/diheme cytochrome c family protein
MLRLVSILIVFLILSQCVKASTTIPTDKVQHIEGKRLYVLYCVSCHNSQPSKPGSIGPELITTPSDVFRTKVPYGTYPSWYKSKRRTKAMPRFPSLKDKTDLIYKYIHSVKGN